MNNWKKVILDKDGNTIKFYVNENDTRAIMFPPFGKYFCFSSDKSALDLGVEILFHKSSESGVVVGLHTYGGYLNSQENTMVIIPEAA